VGGGPIVLALEENWFKVFGMKNLSRLGDLIDELGNADTKAADAAGFAIIDFGHEALPGLIDAVSTATTNIKRRIVFLLGQLGRNAPSFSVAIERILLDALGSEDWKVRRNAAISLGKVGNGSSVQSIVSSLKVEGDPRVRTSLLLTFGKLAEVQDVPLLQEIQLTSDEERNAAHKVADRFSVMMGVVPTVDTESRLSRDVSVELWSRAGVADIVALEATREDLSAMVLAPDRVGLQNPPSLRDLLRIRSALFPVLVLDLPNGYANPIGLGKAFDASPVVAEMIRLTKGMPVGYRLTVKQAGLPSHHKRRDWISQFVAGCEKLVNRATGYSWEVFIRSVNRRVLLGARPVACNDDRFAYRKLDVPASVHPTLAAAAVRLVATQASDLVVDPFCGSGTLLAERALLAPYSRLVGLDIDRKALYAARTNLADFDRLSLEQADFSTVTRHAPVDLIITNPPYGIRVGTHSAARSIHAKLDEVAAVALGPGGTMITFRPPTFSSPPGLQLIRRQRVDAGGLEVDIVVARKQRM
jgi:hypothetical protein